MYLFMYTLMTKTVSATQARKQLFQLLREAGIHGAHVRITLGDKPPVIMMSEEELEGWLETMEIMSDPKLMKGIHEGEKDIAKGRVIPWEKVKKKYKL